MLINQNEQLYVEMIKEQLAEQTRYIDEIRGVKHDMQAHLIVLYHYLEKDEFSKAKEYLSKVMNIPLFCGSFSVDVGHDLVNTIISSRLRRSTVSIELETTGLLPEEMEIDEVDLCVLFSNLISNSVEACEKLTHTDRVISIEIHEDNKDLIITMSNPIEWEVNLDILGKSTTKEDKKSHGYGVRNIQSAVERYNGEVIYEVDNGLVLVKVILRDIV